MSDAADIRVVLLRGRYELLETLGSGGNARLVKALDHKHARLVALKIRQIASERDREDLLREAMKLLIRRCRSSERTSSRAIST
jgi:serine/threonine protein kinase